MKAKIDQSEKSKSIAKLSKISQRLESGFVPTGSIDEVKRKEHENAYKYGGRTIHGWSQKGDTFDSKKSSKGEQLNLF